MILPQPLSIKEKGLKVIGTNLPAGSVGASALPRFSTLTALRGTVLDAGFGYAAPYPA